MQSTVAEWGPLFPSQQKKRARSYTEYVENGRLDLLDPISCTSNNMPSRNTEAALHQVTDCGEIAQTKSSHEENNLRTVQGRAQVTHGRSRLLDKTKTCGSSECETIQRLETISATSRKYDLCVSRISLLPAGASPGA